MAAALMLILPLLVISIYVITECVQAYTIYCTVKQASASASRKFALAYVQDPERTKERWEDICTSIEYPGLVNSYRQFELVNLSENSVPPTVTIRAVYRPDLYGCRHFPQPDLLNLGQYFAISAQTTKKLD
jgi:hypothetical protein